MVTESRGALTRDGCAVEVYRRLPVGDEPSVVHAVAGEHGSVLDLGTGVGRIADPLVELGHRVVAVDESAEMLSHVQLASTVLSSIETLRLDERFDVVLLASHLINTPDVRLRTQLLATVSHHLARDGRAVVQWHEPEWFDRLHPGQVYVGELGDLQSELAIHSLTGDEVSATVHYRDGHQAWSQSFRACRLTTTDVSDLLAGVGLELIDIAAVPTGWLAARRSVA